MYLRFRQKTGQVNAALPGFPVHVPVTSGTSSLRYQVTWTAFSNLLMNNRFEVVETRMEGTGKHYGYLVSQDISYKPAGLPASVTIRYALFDTWSYNERIYSYENDVLYGYSVPAYEGKGIRCFLLVSWSPVRKLEVWVRYAQTFYTDRDIIGTGLDQIDGDLKSEIKLQLRIRI